MSMPYGANRLRVTTSRLTFLSIIFCFTSAVSLAFIYTKLASISIVTAVLAAAAGYLTKAWFDIRNAAVAKAWSMAHVTSDDGKNFSEKTGPAWSYLQDTLATKTPAEILSDYYEPAAEQQPVKEALLFTANYFDEMAVGIYHGHMDNNVLESYYRSIFLRFFTYFRLIIPLLRNKDLEFGKDHPDERGKIEKPHAFEMIEWLNHHWGGSLNTSPERGVWDSRMNGYIDWSDARPKIVTWELPWLVAAHQHLDKPWSSGAKATLAVGAFLVAFIVTAVVVG